MQQSFKEKIKNLSPEQIRKLMAAKKGGTGNSNNSEAQKMPRNDAEIYPLSKAQERIWFLSQLTGSGTLYNIPIAIKLYETISPQKIEIALQRIVESNEILRTTFHQEGGGLVQKIHPPYSFSVDFEDISYFDEAKKDGVLENMAISHAAKTFNLEELPLLTVKLVKLNDQEHVVLLNLHHIISDGWTNMLLSIDTALYQDKAAQKQKPYAYIDFVKWEQDWLKTDAYKAQLEFWKEALQGYEKTVHFPETTESSTFDDEGKLMTCNLPDSLLKQVTAFCAKENCTPFQFYFVCFSILASMYTGEDDIVIGTPVANRNQSQFQETYGLFFNSLPMRFLVDVNQTFLEQLTNSVRRINDFMKRQQVPFTEIIKVVNPKRNTQENALFNIHFAYQHFPKKNKNDEYALMPIDYKTSKFDLNFWIEVAGDNCKISITYKNKKISTSTVERFLSQFHRLVDAALSNPNTAIRQFDVIPKDEQSICYGKLLEHSAPSWLNLFSKAAQNSPNAIAVEHMTYAQLQTESDKLATLFKNKGVEKGDIILINTGRNRNFIIALVACFKSGCAYLPVDENTPEERLAYIIKDSKAIVAFSNKQINGTTTITPEQLAAFNAKEVVPSVAIAPNDIAYVIYTSGTTGNPKGVVVPHKALYNYTMALRDKIGDDTLQSFAHVSSLQADLGNTVIFLALACGGQLLLPSQEALSDPIQLSTLFEKHKPDVLKIVPSHLDAFSELLAKILPTKVLICGGEKLTNRLVDKICAVKDKDLRLINHYGPTETTIGVVTYEVDFNKKQTVIPIGTPIANTQVVIVDAFLKPVPIGVHGEICIGGENLANGYINAPELTTERFVTLPDFSKPFYKTGDRGFVNEEGQIVFVGRTDAQVKLNGFRVELGEIEHVLLKHKAVEHAVVYIEEVKSVKSLCAVVQANHNVSRAELKTHLSRFLPSAFLPSVKFVEAIPLTANGKVDYKRLTVVGETEKPTADVLPRDLIEVQLLEIYSELFPNKSVTIDDNFFDIGGHSLLAIQLVSKINHKFESNLSVSVLFNCNTIKELSALLRKKSTLQKTEDNLIPLSEKGQEQKAVWIHPAGGNVMCYYPIATAFSSIDTAAFTTQSHQNNNSIEAMADAYFKVLKQKKIDNLLLAGWSMGALVAHQMACLFANENRYPPLVLVDQPATSTATSNQISYNERLMSYLQKVHIFTNKEFDEAILAKTTIDFKEVLDEFVRVQLVPEETSLANFKQFLDILVAHNEMVTQFVPKNYKGHVLLLKATENLMQGDIAVSEYKLNDLGWGNHCDNLTIKEVPGNHITMMNAANAPAMTEVINEWLMTLH